MCVVCFGVCVCVDVCGCVCVWLGRCLFRADAGLVWKQALFVLDVEASCCAQQGSANTHTHTHRHAHTHTTTTIHTHTHMRTHTHTHTHTAQTHEQRPTLIYNRHQAEQKFACSFLP